MKWVPKWSEREGLFEVDSIDLSSKPSLTYGGNGNYYKKNWSSCSYSACGNREKPDNFQNKSVDSHFIWVFRYILFLPKLKGKEKPFLEGYKKVGHIVRLSPRTLGWYNKDKSLSFCKIWNNPTPLVFLIRPRYK